MYSSICFVQDKSYESNRPKYLNVETVSSVWPLMVIAGGLFILLRLREISMNLHLEGLRNMVAIYPVLYCIGIWLQVWTISPSLRKWCGTKEYHLHTKRFECQERMDHWLYRWETREGPKLSPQGLLKLHVNFQMLYHSPRRSVSCWLDSYVAIGVQPQAHEFWH